MPETTSKDWDAFNIEKTALKKGSERIKPQDRHLGMKTKKRKSGPIVYVPGAKTTLIHAPHWLRSSMVILVNVSLN